MPVQTPVPPKQSLTTREMSFSPFMLPEDARSGRRNSRPCFFAGGRVVAGGVIKNMFRSVRELNQNRNGSVSWVLPGSCLARGAGILLSESTDWRTDAGHHFRIGKEDASPETGFLVGRVSAWREKSRGSNFILIVYFDGGRSRAFRRLLWSYLGVFWKVLVDGCHGLCAWHALVGGVLVAVFAVGLVVNQFSMTTWLVWWKAGDGGM